MQRRPSNVGKTATLVLTTIHTRGSRVTLTTALNGITKQHRAWESRKRCATFGLDACVSVVPAYADLGVSSETGYEIFTSRVHHNIRNQSYFTWSIDAGYNPPRQDQPMSCFSCAMTSREKLTSYAEVPSIVEGMTTRLVLSK